MNMNMHMVENVFVAMFTMFLWFGIFLIVLNIVARAFN